MFHSVIELPRNEANRFAVLGWFPHFRRRSWKMFWNLGLCNVTKGTNTVSRASDHRGSVSSKMFFLRDASFIPNFSPTPGRGLIHNCGSIREGDRQTGWSSICGDAGTEPISHWVSGFARWSTTLFSPVVKSFKWKNKVVDTGDQNELLSQSGQVPWGIGFSNLQQARSRATYLRWLGHLVRRPAGRLPEEVFQAYPTRNRDYVWLAWEYLEVPTEEPVQGAGWGAGLGFSVKGNWPCHLDGYEMRCKFQYLAFRFCFQWFIEFNDNLKPFEQQQNTLQLQHRGPYLLSFNMGF